VNSSMAAVRAELRRAAVRQSRAYRRRLRALLTTASLVIAALATGLALAATGVLGSAAPPEVVEDFDAYAEQLGYHPRSGRAQLVAADREFLLYATTNREGTYCIVTSVPWRRPGKLTGDGGVCVPPERAAEPIAVAVTAASARGDDDELTLAVVGRVRGREARTIQFADAGGERIERPLGAEGFFVVGVRHACTGESWSPIFKATDSGGNAIATAKITLTYVEPLSRRHGLEKSCGGFEGVPHGPYRFDAQPK
jgi:hypothetical protein